MDMYRINTYFSRAMNVKSIIQALGADEKKINQEFKRLV